MLIRCRNNTRQPDSNIDAHVFLDDAVNILLYAMITAAAAEGVHIPADAITTYDERTMPSTMRPDPPLPGTRKSKAGTVRAATSLIGVKVLPMVSRIGFGVGATPSEYLQLRSGQPSPEADVSARRVFAAALGTQQYERQSGDR